MAFRLCLSPGSLWGYVTFSGDVYFKVVDIAKYLNVESVPNFVSQFGSAQLGAVSHNCPLRMRRWRMIEIFDLLRLLWRVTWGDALLEFFEQGRVQIQYRGSVPYVLRRSRGVKFSSWLRYYQAKILSLGRMGLRF